jgi:hypothetical protein
MQNGANREFYRHVVQATERAERRFVSAFERIIEAYFIENPEQKPHQNRMLQEWQSNLLLYGEIVNLSLLDVAVLKIKKGIDYR